MRRRGSQIFLAVASVVSILIAAGSGIAITTIHSVETTITKLPVGKAAAGKSCAHLACLPSVQPQCIQGVCTFLILGSDSRQGLSKAEQTLYGSTSLVQGQRSDTIIVVRVDPIHGRTVVLSIPRDLRVELPGHGMGRINEAFSYGPDEVVRTVSALTGMAINHYVQVSFEGFEQVVNALGGVPICIDKPMYDQLAGVNLRHAGCYTLHGRLALAFVRARHVSGDVIPDFSRIARQQQFIRAVIRKALSVGSIFQLPKLIRAVQRNLVVDQNLNLYALQDLTQKLALLGQGGVTFRVVPSVPITINGADYVTLVQPDATRLFWRIRFGRPLGNLGVEQLGTAISPASITIRVLDANSGGKAQKVATYLQEAGFQVLPLQQAPATLSRTLLLYGASGQNQESVLSGYLPGISARVDRTGKETIGVDVTVVIGADFKGIEL